MKISIGKHFDFEASHQLPEKECYGKCRNLHGHRYELEIEVEGEINEDGWVCNFSEIGEHVRNSVLRELDHRHLNDILPVPTAENIALWIFQTLCRSIGQREYRLRKVKLYETSNSYAEISRDSREP